VTTGQRTPLIDAGAVVNIVDRSCGVRPTDAASSTSITSSKRRTEALPDLLATVPKFFGRRRRRSLWNKWERK